MMWALVGIGYLVAVAAIVRFFQFVSETDKDIDEFWTKDGKISRLRKNLKKGAKK